MARLQRLSLICLMLCTTTKAFMPSLIPLRTSAQAAVSARMMRSSVSVVCPRMSADNAAGAVSSAPAFSPKGMTVEEFFQRSIGSWRSLRSSHNIAFGQIEEVNSNIDITPVAGKDEELVKICETYKTDPAAASTSIRMSWEGTSDWDEKEVLKGSSVLVVLKDGPNHGRLLRSVGYTDAVPAAGTWEMQEDGTFVLTTLYEKSAAEERIWFGTPDMRMRVSIIKTQGGKGVLTAALSTEVRKKA